MSVDYSKAIRKGLSFGIQPKRWLQFFVMDLIFITVALTLFLPTLPEIFSFLSSSTDTMVQSDIMGMAFSGVLIYLIILFAAWMLVRLWFMGAIVQQSYKEKDKISDTYRLSGKRYGHILLAIVIVTIVIGAVGFIPYIGWVISIALGLMFFFVMQGIMVSKLDFWKSIENSYRIFKKHPVEVFLAWVLITIITMAIYLVFAIPMTVVFFAMIGVLSPMLLAETQPLPAEIVSSLSSALQSNLPALIVVGLIALVGFAITQAFSLKTQTEFYLQLKKKFKVF